jgi:hypothetical protein
MIAGPRGDFACASDRSAPNEQVGPRVFVISAL